VDLGMLFDARGEVQRTADAAAMAGVSVFFPPSVKPSFIVDSARIRMQEYVTHNPVRDGAATITDSHVRIDSMVVRVFLERPDLPTWFARIMGIHSMQVRARAAAEAAASGTAECIKPIMVPDWWVDANNDRKWTDGELYDPNVTGWGTSYRDPGQPGHWYVRHQPDYYRDWGRPDTLKQGSPGQNMTPAWYFPFRLGDGVGGDDYRKALASACAVATMSVGDWVYSEPGNMNGPTLQGIRDAIAADPSAYWDTSTNRIEGSRFGSGERSPRVATFPLFDPSQQIPGGTSAPIQVNGFGSFFIDSVDSNRNIVGRWLRVRAVPDQCKQRGTCRAALMYPRLIE
jgi:hypothetical protein